MLNKDAAEACFNDLNQHNLLQHYQRHEAKNSGCMDGLVLFGKRKNGADKKVFVKKYQSYLGMEFHELDDLLVFNIARSIGFVVPKVKIKSTSQFNYLFSTNITDCQDAEFVPLEQLIVRNSIYERKPLDSILIGKNKEIILFDSADLAKFILFCLVMRLCDLKASNTGILLSKTFGLTAKIAMIDFSILYKSILIPENLPQHSLSELVASQPALRNFLKLSSLCVLDETDFQQAFLKLEQDFLPACAAAAAKLNCTDPEKLARCQKLLSSWKTNFLRLQTFITNTHRASMSP